MAQQKTREEIIHLLKTDLGDEDIAKLLKVDVRTVRAARKKGSAIRKPYKPRKQCVLSAKAKKMITKCVKDVVAGPGIKKVASILRSANLRGSASSIRRFVTAQEWGKSYKGVVVPLLSKKNLKDRLIFAKRARNELGVHNAQRWGDVRDFVCFTDESVIPLHGLPNRQNVRIRTANPENAKFIKSVKHDPVTLQVYAGITARGLTELRFLEKEVRINAALYRGKILPNYLADLKGLYGDEIDRVLLQEDGAKPHTAKISSAWVKKNFLAGPLLPSTTASYDTFMWPGNSPDLNPIEQMWTRLKDSIYQKPQPTDKETLKARLTKTWKILEKEGLHLKLIESFPTRLRKLEINLGHHTGY